jgi:PKD repeat protein
MPLTIQNATTNWDLSGKLLLPTAPRLSGIGGAAQPYASSLIVANANPSWNLSGRLLQPKISAQRGAGGAAQNYAASLIIVNANPSWTLSPRLLAAGFSFTIAPDGFSVLYQSTTGDAPDLLTWDLGDGNSSGSLAPSRIYENVGTYSVTLTATRSRGFETSPITSKKTRSITILGGAEPDESLDDVLNLEYGRHAYEPIRVQAADVGENVSFHNEALNLAAGAQASLLFYTPDRTIRLRQVTATGSGDGLFRLILNGQTIDVKRSYATQRNVRFDLEDEIKLTVTDTLEVQVVNATAQPQSFEAALLGRTV